jgi:hypothetical protein
MFLVTRINHIKWKNAGTENFRAGLINLNVEIKINPKTPFGGQTPPHIILKINKPHNKINFLDFRSFSK